MKELKEIHIAHSILKKMLIVALLVVIAACNNEKEPVDYAIISGKFNNTAKTEFELKGDRYNPFSKTIELENDGSFHDTLHLPKWNRNYSIYVLETMINLHIRKGDNIQINLNTTRVENPVVFKGIGASYNNYLLAKEKKKLELRPEKWYAIYSLDEKEFIQKTNLLKNEYLTLLKESEGLAKDYIIQEEKDITYENMMLFGNYDYFHGRELGQSNFKSSEQFMEQYFACDFEDEAQFQNSFSYQKFVYNRLKHIRAAKIMRPKEEGKAFDLDLETLKIIFKEVKNKSIKETLFFIKIKESLKSSRNAENKTKYFNYYIENATDDGSKKEAILLFNDAKKLWKGNPSPKFFNYQNHAGGTTSLDDLKGKYVYIDVWATWCSPCKAQIPYLKEIEKEYRDKNIVFVGISVDLKEYTKKWEQMVVDMELTGIQLLADNDFNSEFIKSYNITGIPRFILIDPEGNIVTQNAPRPSQEKLIELFNELGI